MLLVNNQIGFFVDTQLGTHTSSSNMNAATVVFQYSYASENQLTGTSAHSVLFLTPALNIVFSESLRVTFDPKLCIATGAVVTTWNLGHAKGNFDVCVSLT